MTTEESIRLEGKIDEAVLPAPLESCKTNDESNPILSKNEAHTESKVCKPCIRTPQTYREDYG